MRNLLMTPGPTPVPEDSRFIMAKDIIHHRTEEFMTLFKEMSESLKYVFQTQNPVITLTSSGTGAMEASIINLFSENDKVVVISVGNFGDRLIQLAKLYKLNVIEISYKWGETAKVEDLKAVLAKEEGVKGVIMTQHETSTGVVNDIEAFGKVIKDTDMLFVVDAISGLTANEFKTDEWGVDCALSGSQKGFMAPPGLAFAALSPKAQAAMEKSTLPKFYFSFKKALKILDDGQTPWTPAIGVVMAVNESCKMIKKEGIENVVARHKSMQEATVAGVEALGLELLIKEPKDRGATLTTVLCPEGLNGQKVNKLMSKKYGITIAGGQGELQGKIFRIGHLGGVDTLDVVTTFSALEMVLKELGYNNFEPGDSLKAIQKYLMSKI